jgi:carboxypeptidase T
MYRFISFRALALCFILLSTQSFSQEIYSKIKIHTDSKGLQQLAELGVGIDHGQIKRDTWFISDFSATDLQRISAAGFTYDILVNDVSKWFEERNAQALESLGLKDGDVCAPALIDPTSYLGIPEHFELGSMGGYFTYEEFLDELDEMVSLYPNLISAKAPIHTFQTHEGRPVYFVKLSNSPTTENNKPYVLYTAIHHAREPASLSQLIYFMWYLLENYGTNAEVTYLVDYTQLLFVPMMNPDGYIRNQTTNPNGGGMWRKNRRNNGNGSFGVDNNRNYSYQWNTTGVSSDPSSDVYPGPSAFSEPETQAIRWLSQNYPIRLAFNAHTYGNTVLYPIGSTAAEFAQHHNYFADICGHMCTHNNYFPQKSSGLYPASGDSDDYMYKVDIGVGVKDTIFAITPEIGEDFWPLATRIVPIARENVFPNLVLAHLAGKYGVTKDTDPGSIDAISGNFTHSFQRLGLVDGEITVSINPVSGIATVGAPVVYDLAIRQSVNGTIAYTLEADLPGGSEIVYELLTDNGFWVRRDTIRKLFGTPTLQFNDPAASLSNWTGNWGLATNTFVSPSNSFTDSPGANYTSNANSIFILNDAVDLTNSSSAMARFYAKWAIEADWDFASFEASTDNGQTWTQLCGKFTNPGVAQPNWWGQNQGIQPVDKPIYDGIQSEWVLEEVSLNDFLGQLIRLRFRLRSDGNTNDDGFYFDDFQLFYDQDGTGDLTALNSVQWNLFPNPSSSIVSLDFGSAYPSGSVLVVDQQGKEISQLALDGQVNQLTLNIENFPGGVYFVVVNSTTHHFGTKRLVVLR